jgi:hypothetical protein
MPAQLAEAPEIPEMALHVWKAFWSLSRFRENNGMAVQPITPALIRDWSWVFGEVLAPWEIEAITQLDRLYLAEG